MTRVIVLGLIAAVALWLLFRFLGSNYFGRGKTRADFGHAIRSLLLLMDEGGILRIHQQGSEVQFDFVRASGSDDAADLVLLIPRASWSLAVESNLEKVFDANEFDTSFSAEQPEGVLCKVRMHVSDIWDEACGARAARAAHLLVDTASIARDAKFDFALLGERSNRIAKRGTRVG